MKSLPSNDDRAALSQSPSLLMLIVLIAMPACSFLTDFDHDKKPCDGYLKCEDGYFCQIQDKEKGTGTCIKGSSGLLPVRTMSQAITAPDGSSIIDLDALPSEDILSCQENACLPWPGHVCDVARQLCVPVM
jgi:hypothetical protein